ncbi:MAG: cysteine methyltransferase [Rhodospirillaceae bacterium]|nr:MAG: cysteine methyltransferase [Rhodospirillaceae bacterium]
MDMLSLKSPVGELTLFAEAGNITALSWGRGAEAPRQSKNPILRLAQDLLVVYFETGQDQFNRLSFDPHGTAFQKRVWQQMCIIKAGNTKSYGDIAKILGSGPRAVGGACGANPIPILIPCHRIINTDGAQGHYSGGDGPYTKKVLLELEQGSV